MKERMAAFRKRLRNLKQQAAEELFTRGRTRRYRRLWQSIEALQDDIEDLVFLNTPDDFLRCGFVTDDDTDTKTEPQKQQRCCF